MVKHHVRSSFGYMDDEATMLGDNISYVARKKYHFLNLIDLVDETLKSFRFNLP